MISTIILDLDGPILDGRARHHTCYAEIIIEHGFRPLEIDAYWQGKRNKTDRRSLLRESDAVELYDVFLHEWLQRIELPRMLALDRLQPEVLSILTDWKESRIELVLATMRNHASHVACQLESLGIMPFFEQVFVTGSEQGFGGKVDAVREFLQDKSPSTALWVGDTEVDICAARTLGIPVCALTCGLRTPELLAAENPDFLLDDLRDVQQLVRKLAES